MTIFLLSVFEAILTFCHSRSWGGFQSKTRLNFDSTRNFCGFALTFQTTRTPQRVLHRSRCAVKPVADLLPLHSYQHAPTGGDSIPNNLMRGRARVRVVQLCGSCNTKGTFLQSKSHTSVLRLRPLQ